MNHLNCHKWTRLLFPLGLSLALLLGGCQSDPSESKRPSVGEVTPPTPVPTQTVPPFAENGMRIAFCTSPDTIDDGGRNSVCYDSLLAFFLSREGIDSLVPLQEPTGDPLTAPQTFQELLSSYDVMIFVGPAFSRIAPLAQQSPDTYFILMDAPLTDENGISASLPNVCSLEFAEQECGFFAGMTAAMESETGRVAVITDTPSQASTRYYYGFRSGVAYSNGNLGTSAEIIDHPSYGGIGEDGTPLGGNYTGGNDDTAYALTNSLIDEGCDILFVAAGNSGDAALSAIKERPGVRMIGGETDQYLNGTVGSENVVLTSVTKDFFAALRWELDSIANGTFRGESRTLRCTDNATGYVSADDRQQLKPETLSALAQAYSLMQEGTIVPLAGPPAE